MTADATIAERHETHGPWAEQSATAQALKGILHQSRNWSQLSPSQREALELIAVKLSRIVNGNPNHADSWHDVQGYARLGELGCEAGGEVLNG